MSRLENKPGVLGMIFMNVLVIPQELLLILSEFQDNSKPKKKKTEVRCVFGCLDLN